MLRKKHGKKSQRRKYSEESSAPKRRKIGDDEYKELRRTSRDGEGGRKSNQEKRSLEDPVVATLTEKVKKRKTQTVMEKYMRTIEEHVDVVDVEICAETEVDGQKSVSEKNSKDGDSQHVDVVDGEMSMKGPGVNQSVDTHIRGETSEIIPSDQICQGGDE